MMLNTLNQAKKEKNIIGIYADSDDTSKYSVGYIDEIFEEGILISIITPNAKNGGYALISIDLVYLLEYNTVYLNNIQKLFELNKEETNKFGFTRNNEESLIIDFLKFCKKNKFLVNIKHTYNFNIFVSISDLDDETIAFNTYNNDLLPDGTTIIYIEHINEIYWNNNTII